MAISLLQEGSGFPFFAPPIYQYLCGADIATIEVAMEDIPDFEVRNLIEEVQLNRITFIA